MSNKINTINYYHQLSLFSPQTKENPDMDQNQNGYKKGQEARGSYNRPDLD